MPHETVAGSVVGYTILSLFIAEQGLKIYAEGWRDYWSDYFNRVDFAVILLSLLSAITISIINAAAATSGDAQVESFFSHLSLYIRVIRLIRVLRLFRRSKLMLESKPTYRF